MSRTFQDADLLKWEAYASGGPKGAEEARIVFHCLSDRARRARVVQLGGDQSEAERAVAEASESRLAEMLATAVEIG